MKYQIVGKNIVVTDAIHDAIVKKLSRMDKYFDEGSDINCRAVVRSYKNGAKVEITIYGKGITFRTEVTDADLYAAVDLSIDKLEGQMRKLKTKIENKYGHEGIGKSIIYEQIKDDENEPEEVVRTKSYDLKPITLDEAIFEMEAVGHDFYLYLDTDDEKISVVYKRKDGGYGCIQAENKVEIK